LASADDQGRARIHLLTLEADSMICDDTVVDLRHFRSILLDRDRRNVTSSEA
jgi:hypothetical protein